MHRLFMNPTTPLFLHWEDRSGKVNYQNIELAAEVISMNLDSSTVHAYGIKDSTGVEKGKPVFKEGDTSYDTETIRYNFKTKKAWITDIVTQQG